MANVLNVNNNSVSAASVDGDSPMTLDNVDLNHVKRIVFRMFNSLEESEKDNRNPVPFIWNNENYRAWYVKAKNGARIVNIQALEEYEKSSQLKKIGISSAHEPKHLTVFVNNKEAAAKEVITKSEYEKIIAAQSAAQDAARCLLQEEQLKQLEKELEKISLAKK